MTRPTIALCMIVRDASATLDALLESVRGAFDEYIFVDTGSNDDTCDKITRFSESLPEGQSVRLDHFDWIGDFAAARNYSFNLAVSDWRMYLDADDVLPNAEHLRAFVAALEERDPRVNAVSMRYVYARGSTEQDKIRLVRWREKDGSLVGWRWEDEVHEFLTCAPKPRMISKAAAYVVHHMKPWEGHVASAVRNRLIIDRVYETATGAKRGRFAYHKAQLVRADELWTETLSLLREVVDALPGTNMAAYALFDMAFISLFKLGRIEQGLMFAATMTSQMPSYREGFFLNAIACAMRGDNRAAETVFDRALAMEPTPLESVREVWFSDGVAQAWAALVYLRRGRLDDADKRLASIPADVAQHSEVAGLLAVAQQELMQHKGLAALRGLVDYLCWDTEALKALKLLDECVPAAIATRVEIGRMKRGLQQKLKHLESWEAYKEAYASIPPSTYHTAEEHRAGVLDLARTQRVVAWAKGLEPEGPPIVVGSVGFQDGIIEAAVMEANPRIRFVVCDVAPQANRGLADLMERFPGRVTHHQMTSDYDWGSGETPYDALFIFEVIEHVRHEDCALEVLRCLLKEDGTLFLSTPVASRWVEPYLTAPGLAPAWYGHVRANNHVSLGELLERHGFRGEVYEEHDGTFVAHMQRGPALTRNTQAARYRRVSIYVPWTPKPFNAFSHRTGFVGGSEECVIHLAQHLAMQGFAVTVYAPEPAGYPIVRWSGGVCWRPVSEFDDAGDHGAVLFWRCPELVPASAPYRKLLWLHDASYGVDGSVYERADEVLVLSQSHAESIRARDGYRGLVRAVSNGVDADAFPPIDDVGREPHRVIYASSPERGLARLLRVWPDIVRKVPDAHLDIYYDWTSFDALRPEESRELRLAIDEANVRGSTITRHGGVSHDELHAAFRRAGVWAYPTSGDVETFCITAVKAVASGCNIVASNAGALAEVLDGDVVERLTDKILDTPEGDELFKRSLINALTQGSSLEERQSKRRRILERFAWANVASRFARVISGVE